MGRFIDVSDLKIYLRKVIFAKTRNTSFENMECWCLSFPDQWVFSEVGCEGVTLE